MARPSPRAIVRDVTPLSLRLGGQSLDLLPERAAFWRETSTLLVADCHFGKTASFRRHGLPVPEGGTADDLGRLDALIARTQAQRLLVVGDFFHSPSGYGADVIDALVAWRTRHDNLCVALVPGNHDRSLQRLPPALRFDIVSDPHVEGGLAFVHDPGHVPPTDPSGANAPPGSSIESARSRGHICGHLHPAIRLGDRRVRGLTAPCFWVQRGTVLVLPSFGAFTGSVAIAPEAGDRVFAVAAGRVVEVPGAVLGRW